MTLSKRDSSDSAQSPEARVHAFVADYYAAHRAAAKIIHAGDFDAWREIIAQLEAAHFVVGGRSRLDDVLSSDADHHPDDEKVTSCTANAQFAAIQTEDPKSPITRYYEYDLRCVDGDWRIASLRGYVESPDEPFMNPEQQAQFQNPAIRAFRALPGNESAFDGNALFAAGRAVQVDAESSTLEVRRVGNLNVTTGVLVVGDLGYDPFTLAPLGQRIAPGRYPVEVSIAFQRIAALRMRLADRPVTAWHPADMGSDGGHVVGVDAANVSISDVSALLSIKTRHKEKQFERFAEANELTSALMLSLVNPDDSVIATSGYGDGAYPSYWGVDAAGKPVVLVVDMLVFPSQSA